MDRVEDFLYHEDPIVKQAAQSVATLAEGLENGDMTKEQFAELVEDVLEVQEVRRMADTLDRKIMILQAFNAIKTIVGVLAK